MTQAIVIAKPPMFDEIAAAFHLARMPGVIFSWGEAIIFNPSGVHISPALLAHEAVHGARQGLNDAGIRHWWETYIADPEFRLREEMPAHRAEYAAIKGLVKDRNERVRELHHIVNKLCGPLYGKMISRQDAFRAVAA